MSKKVKKLKKRVKELEYVYGKVADGVNAITSRLIEDDRRSADIAARFDKIRGDIFAG